MSRLKVGVLHPGTQHSWQTALALQEGGALGWYATSIFYDPDRWPYRVERFLPPPLADRTGRAFRRRYEPRLDPGLIRRLGTWPWIALGVSALAQGSAAAWAIRQGNIDVGRRAVRLLEREPVDLVWAYDSAALEIFRWAKQRGIRCVLDRTIAHGVTANRVMSAEYARHPDFFLAPFVPKPAHQLAEEQEELELADAVLVGSQYCAATLVENGCAAGKIHVLNYGYDERAFPAEPPVRSLPRDGPVEFLFAGAAGPRKGIAYLLQAFQQISPQKARLTLMGQLQIPPATFARFEAHVRHLAHVGRAEIVQHFARAHCFVFPSLVEGSAIVLREIYGAGLGAVHSRSAGEGVTDGVNGIVLPEPSVPALVDAVERILADRECLARWNDAAWRLRGNCTWSAYRQRVRDFVAGLARGEEKPQATPPRAERSALQVEATHAP